MYNIYIYIYIYIYVKKIIETKEGLNIFDPADVLKRIMFMNIMENRLYLQAMQYSCNLFFQLTSLPDTGKLEITFP